MGYYTFKLNLEPNILEAHHYDTQKSNVIEVVIPKALEGIFNSFVEIDESKIKFMDYIDIESVERSLEYKKMVKVNADMKEMYHKVLNDYNNGKGIVYSPEYLDKREELKDAIERLIKINPFLKGAFDIKDSIFQVEAFSTVKMSVAYIRKAMKIEYYINNFPKSELNSEFIYDKSNEYIYISTNNRSNEEAITYIELLEEKINNFSANTNIGQVSINPIYEKFLFDGMYSEVTIELVYPNGDPSRDRSRAIEEANAAKEIRTFSASKESKIDASKLNEYFKKDGEKGYIRKVHSRGRNIVKSLIKIVRF